MEQRLKNEQAEGKLTFSLCSANVFKFQENKFKIIQNDF